MDKLFLRKAIESAIESRQSGNEPFGTILVKGNEIVMIGKNEINSRCDPTHHAEIGLLRAYCSENNLSDLSE